jgi:hypothetical protein
LVIFGPFDRDALLARTDVVEITTSRDVAYRTSRTYRAVALAKLFDGVTIPPDAVVEAAAQDSRRAARLCAG